jgi:hypothetical protein
MNLIEALRNLLSQAEADDGDGIGETEETAPETGQDADSIRADDAPAPESSAFDGVEDSSQVAEAGAGVTDAAEEGSDAQGETLPESEVATAELRESLVTLGTENERLRNMVVDLGGDPDAGSDIEEDADDEDSGSYYADDDEAVADIDAQKKQIAELLGNN